MLKILIPTFMLMLVAWLSTPKWFWSTMTLNSLLIAMLSVTWFNLPYEHMLIVNNFMGLDQLSSPLMILTCWLLPLMIMASQNHLKNTTLSWQRTYMIMLIILQASLILAFSATEFMLFYISFETTLIPTLIIITRWGNQAERLNAGTYFLFYTLAGSMPLLIALLIMQNSLTSLSFIILDLMPPMMLTLYYNKIWWAACLLAFLVKMPLYGAHLWLPKAHVEAPIAGSMILAAVLLKLGGYGILRVSMMLSQASEELSYPFIILALWGVMMTGLICTRQTDLKSLIAYSSVSHMGLVIAAAMIQTPWSYAGAITLMISHGLTSSVLFCLANLNYERTHSRTLLLMRGSQTILPLMMTWWLLSNLLNMAIPPSTNMWGELLIITSLFNWSSYTILITGISTVITAVYTLYIYLMTQQGPTIKTINNIFPSYTREHLLIVLHLMPMFLLLFNPGLIMGLY
uniref:NADH-ubiquinone oxidoreductase chain 4 n=1 Tax=Andrias davidianus TaxID=141262 RepID=Q7Y8U9_ANDDA|nr:NADH dehydrogenase subunit 4 [Andrias davidianus]APB92121.1 NADH dehydrogenase subunit 4 [Andrias davidianus]APB92238.1 NADH dehydrogenase subunit 4 [Andrias davidianus]APB92251.1 NADH dehydrogenase subunit 4 [Andrias davidianus]APB92264.1 NADH dehydrogenase subunit 4 [Andrias davidianus]APB92290.1 NADH dehydrogenase subunit 4 [Andrias davidianus]